MMVRICQRESALKDGESALEDGESALKDGEITPHDQPRLMHEDRTLEDDKTPLEDGRVLDDWWDLLNMGGEGLSPEWGRNVRRKTCM